MDDSKLTVYDVTKQVRSYKDYFMAIDGVDGFSIGEMEDYKGVTPNADGMMLLRNKDADVVVILTSRLSQPTSAIALPSELPSNLHSRIDIAFEGARSSMLLYTQV